ncbi:ComEC/Rec2 family competence protein [Candidatus Trichorickettsia mobilis]|uniref:ComEC/Rec2 family competence protein n=1 Tax=Candidatus Trichorickettsia mobilis TaxID=1346319 RepID=A0ABZ0UUL5_9RICK|nr:ComEC/Rec2 family competence protein [Candidatus Trichorickettsia mobilis]WPY00683.1 ComEC/Rec2 family competence protein [Candidatus Trichorickettsia mobilis]
MSIVWHYLVNKLHEEYHHLSLWYVVAFISGIAVYFSLAFEPSILQIIIIAISSLASLYLRKYGIVGQFLSWLIIAFVCGILVSKYRVTTINTINIKSSITSELTGNVKAIKPITSGWQVVLDDVTVDKLDIQLSGVRVNINKRYMKHTKEIFINNRIKMIAELDALPTSMVPGGYDFGFYAYFAGIEATGNALSTVEILSNRQHGTKIDTLIYKLRVSIYNKLITALGSNEGNFAAAILLGETKGLDNKIMQNMRMSGISHILCVSGLHLSLVAMILFVSIRFLLNLFDLIAYNCNIKLIAAICSLIGSYGYLHLSGMQIAATRAFIMTAIFIIAIIAGRTPYPLRSIALAAAFILSVNPEYIFHPSFQLSFIAVLSLISGYEFYMRHQWILGERIGVISKIRFYLASNIYSSFLASVITGPVVINQFYIFSNYSILMNLIAVPIMSFFLMPLAILLVVLIPFNMDWMVMKSLGFFINIIINSAQIAHDAPGSVWYFGYITPFSFITFLFGFAWVCLWQTRWRLAGIIIILISFGLMLCSPKPDLLVDLKSNAIAVKNINNQLEIYSNNKISKFQRQYWANWFGQQYALLLPLNFHNFTTATGKKIGINYQDSECDLKNNKDVQLNMRDHNQCINGKLNISYELLKSVGVIAIFCDWNKCRIKYNYPRHFN